MKKFMLLNFAMLFIAITAFGGNSKAELFDYDKKEVQSEFEEINQVEQFVSTHQDATFQDVQSFYDANGLNNPSKGMVPLFSIDDMEWGAFAWGFLCCPVGFFVVGINDSKRQDEKTSYWIGVVTSAVIGTIGTLTTPVIYTN